MPPSHSVISSRPWLRFSLFILLFLAFALRLLELTRQDIWWDEARNIDVALRPFSQIASSPELDIQPPLYYWLLGGWLRLAGIQMGADGVVIAYVARFFSVFYGVLGVALLYRLALCCATQSVALAIMSLGTFSPFWLAESQETRMYTLGLVWVMTGAIVWLRTMESGVWRATAFAGRGTWWDLGYQNLLFAFFAALALATHYNAIFVLVSWWLAWSLWALWQADRWRQVRGAVVTGCLFLLLFTPFMPIALRQIPTYANPNLIVPSLLEYLRQNWQAHVGGYAFVPSLMGGYAQTWLYGILLVAIGGVLAMVVRALFPARVGLEHPWQRVGPTFREGTAPSRKETSPNQLRVNSPFREGSFPFPEGWRNSIRRLFGEGTPHLVFLAVWLLGGLALYYVAVRDRGAFNVRYSSFMTPPLYVLIGIGLLAWQRWWRPLAGLLSILVIGGMIVLLRADLYALETSREDTAGVVAWLRENAQPDDLILVDQKYPLGFYYDRFQIDPHKESSGTEVAAARYLFVDINTIDQQLSTWAADAKRVFWVQWFESDTDPRHSVFFLLNQAGHWMGAQSFQGYVIDWWELTPPNRFELAPNLQPLTLRFGAAVETSEVSLATAALPTGAGIPVVVRWQRVAGGSSERPLKARVALYDATDARRTQSDERLLNDRHLAPSQWLASDQPLNAYWLERPGDLAAGEYMLRLLVYDAETLEALPLIDAAGNEAGIEAQIGAIKLE